MEPTWLTQDLVQALHAEVIAAFGGSPGLRDVGLLESALDRPRNLFAYGDDPSIFDLAAVYCAGIVKNHPFIDGIKRSGLLSARAFLFRNGNLFEPEERDEVTIMVALAAGDIDEAALAAWFEEYTEPKPS